MADDTFAGPINYVALALPSEADLHPVAAALTAAVGTGALELLDLEFLVRDEAGELTRADLSETALAPLKTVETDLLDPEDLAALSAETAAAAESILVVVYEDRSLAKLALAVTAQGGHEIWSGGVSLNDLEQVLGDETEES